MSFAQTAGAWPVLPNKLLAASYAEARASGLVAGHRRVLADYTSAPFDADVYPVVEVLRKDRHRRAPLTVFRADGRLNAPALLRRARRPIHAPAAWADARPGVVGPAYVLRAGVLREVAELPVG